MKRIVFILLVAALSAVSLRAQTESTVETLPIETHPQPLPMSEGGDYLHEQIVSAPRPVSEGSGYLQEHLVSAPRPIGRGWGWVPWGWVPWGWFSGMGNWSLHEGLNMNLGTSVFGSWGGSKYLGTGFTQDISMMYAVPLSSKLSLAVGGYFSNMFFAHDSYRSAGLSGVLSYRFNDHWEAYVYGQKSLVETSRQIPLWGLGNYGDRIGAGVIYHVDPTLSFEVNVEYMHLPDRFAHKYYDYRSPLTPTTHGAPPPPR